MELQRLKRTIARVEIDGKPNGTAFLVDRTHVATALHVLDRRSSVDLVFPEWPALDRERTGTLIWPNPAGYDVAVIALDREAPSAIEPIPWASAVVNDGDSWCSWGFPSEVPNGHTVEDRVKDPSLLIEAWEQRILQLETPAADYDLGGMSGAPCMINGAIVGVITHQLRRALSGGGEDVREPSLRTLYGLPVALLMNAPVRYTMAEPVSPVLLPETEGLFERALARLGLIGRVVVVAIAVIVVLGIRHYFGRSGVNGPPPAESPARLDIDRWIKDTASLPDKAFIPPPAVALSALSDPDLLSVIERTTSESPDAERPLLDEALRRHPDDPSINERDGLWYYKVKRYPEALAAVDQAIKAGADGNAYHLRAKCRRQLGDIPGYEADIRVACLKGARGDWCEGW